MCALLHRNRPSSSPEHRAPGHPCKVPVSSLPALLYTAPSTTREHGSGEVHAGNCSQKAYGYSTWFCCSPALSQEASHRYPVGQPENQHRCSSPQCNWRSANTGTHSVISMHQAHYPASRHLSPWHSTWHLYTCTPINNKICQTVMERSDKIDTRCIFPPSQLGQADEIAIL